MAYPNSSRVLKKVINGMGEVVPCCWFECDKPGYELHKTILHEHAKNMTCDHPMSSHVNFVFCGERHRMLFLHSHKEMGKLPPGYRLVGL